jgi:hypothetical protein
MVHTLHNHGVIFLKVFHQKSIVLDPFLVVAQAVVHPVVGVAADSVVVAVVVAAAVVGKS